MCVEMCGAVSSAEHNVHDVVDRAVMQCIALNVCMYIFCIAQQAVALPSEAETLAN